MFRPNGWLRSEHGALWCLFAKVTECPQVDYNPGFLAPSPLGFTLPFFIINSDRKFPGLVTEFVFVSVLFPFALHFPKYDERSCAL